MEDTRYGRETWDGKVVEEFTSEEGITDPIGTAYRIAFSYESVKKTIADSFAELLADLRANELTSLVIGTWAEWVGEDDDAVAELVGLLVGASEQLSNLTSLFIGDIESEECEISWIRQGDLSPLFGAFPQLESLGIRGGQRLTLGIPRHKNLRKLVIETGGLPATVVNEITAGELPALEHLELWLGTNNYGWDGAIEDLAPFLEGTQWPKLTYLGLRDSEIADEIAQHIAHAPILHQIKILDLSMGTLSDVGAEALLANRAALAHLEKLDLHYHYLSTDMITRLQGLGITVDASDQQDEYKYGDESYRYIAVGE